MAVRFAASMALVAFGALCVRGALGGDGFASVVPRALAAMAVFGAVGYAIGLLARNAVRESVAREIDEAERREQEAVDQAGAEVGGTPSEGSPPEP